MNSFSYGYLLYGLRIASNQPRPDMPHLATHAWPTADMIVDFVGDQPLPTSYANLPWRLVQQRGDRTRNQQAWVATTPTGLAHRYGIRAEDDYLEVIALPNAQQRPNHVEVYWHNSQQSPDEHWYNATTWFFDIALGYLLRWRIPANLHGNALAMDGKAIALVGAKGMGKSTLTAALIAAGYTMLTDDHIALWRRDGLFWVEPGAPRLRLWPTSLPVLDVTAEELPPVYTFQEKRVKHLHTGSDEQQVEFHASPLPLGAIYLLEPRDGARTAAMIAQVPAREALIALWGHRFSLVSISAEQSAQEFGVLAQLAQQVRVCRLYRPDGLTSLPQVIAAIRDDLARA